MADPPPGVPPGSVQDQGDPELWHAPPDTPDGETWPSDPADDPSYPPLPPPDGYTQPSDPEVPVPGLVGDDQILADLIAGIDPNQPAPDYPDAEAPASADWIARREMVNAMPYQSTIRAIAADGTPTDYSVCASTADALRLAVRAWLLCPPWGHAGWPPTVLLQTRDVIADKYVDLSGSNPSPDPAWDGWAMVEVRVMAGGKL